MPIPGLSNKTKSPQTWRKKNPRRGYRTRTSFSKKPIYVGRSKKRFTPQKLAKAGLILLVAGLAFGGISSLVILGWVAKDLPNPDRIIDRTIAQSTKIYDRTGETLLYDVHGAEKRTVVELEDIPDYVKQATITTEDRKFYEHKGISITGILRSVIKNITTGSKVGGSTLTQQLVKNAILSPEKKYSRKIKEIILSYQIEKKFSKDEILKMYFNEIPYGSVAYGVEAAAQTYFAKSVDELTLGEATILAALPQAPTYYSPYGSHTDKLFGRQQYILDSMVEEGYITDTDAQAAKDEKIEFKKRSENIIAPHFVMYVREYLTQKYGELAVEQGGLQVITTLDLYKQEIAEEVVAEWAEKNSQNWEANNAALVALDPKTGEILTMVGSKDYFADPEPEDCEPGKTCVFDPQVNVTLRLRQPGSSFKPIIYAAAFKKGYTPDTILYDVVTKFKNYDAKDYEPKNYDLAEHGPVTIRKAIQGSLNIPAVKAIYLTGVDNVIDLAEDLGYTSLEQRSRFGLSLVLGGGEVKLIEHVNAFATFGREGELHALSPILEVRDKDGDELEKFKRKEKKVLATQVARQINNVLSDNAARAYIFGENNYLTLGGRPVGAKTGTTNDYRDAWTIGYTPSLAAGVWVGNNNNESMKRGAAGGVVAAPIWHAFMSRVLGDTPIEQFKAPDVVNTDKPALNGSIAEGVKVKIDKISGKLATNLTPDHLVEEKIFKEAHNIMYYIDKDDPQGSTAPTRGGDQYDRWEEAVQRWADENDYITDQPPTEYDDVHTTADRPSIKITSPSSNQSVSDRTLNASVLASAARGVKKVEYYLNNRLLKIVTTAPFDLSIYIEDPNIRTGFYPFKAIAYDDLGNLDGDEVELNFQLPGIDPALTWISPTDNQVLSADDFPFTVTADLDKIDSIQKIDLYYGSNNYINTARQFPGGKLIAQWLNVPAAGQYQLHAEITNKSGYSYKSDEIVVEIQ